MSVLNKVQANAVECDFGMYQVKVTISARQQMQRVVREKICSLIFCEVDPNLTSTDGI